MPRTLSQQQRHIRQKLLRLYYGASCGHIACSLSCIDIVQAAYSWKAASEEFILSKGHAAGAMYVVLNALGRISDEQLTSFYKDGTKLAAHPSAGTSRDIPFALGSLGHGLPIATGIAYGKNHVGLADRTFVLMSDGETNEGTTWEAAHFAVRNSLSGLFVIIDKNGLQGFGRTSDVLGDTADPAVWRAMGFRVIEGDGHNEAFLKSFMDETRPDADGRPTVLIANTVKGCGVPYMEDKLEWHYLPMNKELFDDAMTYLEESGHAE
ncbi:MAG: transketolase [Candidatus Kapabacteria bacterium]|nr:transketolase [Candidatus Kapabacteria bacterium]